MQHRYNFNDPRPLQPDNYPMMCWGQNNKYCAAALMWTLFFGGKDFAPDFFIDGLNVQEYLQKHFLDCVQEIASRIKDYPNVLGFDSLNEPCAGWIGKAMDDRHLYNRKNDYALPGLAWSPIDALFSSYGYSIKIPDLQLSILKGGFVPKKYVESNPNHVSLWLDNRHDPFLEAGAWEIRDDSLVIQKNNWFQQVDDHHVDFDNDYMFPFVNRVSDTIRKINDDWIILAEKDAAMAFFDCAFPSNLPVRSANVTHWYDPVISGMKNFFYPFSLDVMEKKVVAGAKGIQHLYERQLQRIIHASDCIEGGLPTLIGEFGIQFDMDKGKTYQKFAQGNHSPKLWFKQSLALDIMFNAMDALLLSCTLWNYAASNRNDLRIGDGWNQEDCSVFSIDQQIDKNDINSGGRGLEGFLRPYARFIQGIPLKMEFNRKKGIFDLHFIADPLIIQPTEIFIPNYRYPNGYDLKADELEIVQGTPDSQLIWLKAKTAKEFDITIARK
jgi:hypothetical protein